MDQKTSAPSLFLRRIAGGIVTGRWVILILTLAAMVFCAFSSFWVQVDSSLASFLAEDAEARRGIRIMAQEFQTYATAQVMVEDVSMAGAETVRQTIAVAQLIPQYRQTEGQGRRRLLTPDEILRLPNDELLCVIRGHNLLRLKKLDYTRHPMAKELQPSSIMNYTPAPLPVRNTQPQAAPNEQAEKKKPARHSLYSSAKPPEEF